MHFLQQNALAIQALSAVAMVLLTLALVFVTVFYVRTTHQMLAVSSKQARADFQPQLLPVFKYKWEDGIAKGDISLTNVGKYYFKIVRITLDFYCSHSGETIMEPDEFQLLTYRAVVAGNTVSAYFNWDPTGDKIFHEEHDGGCHWIARLDIVVEDLFGFGRHHYSYDESLGLSYIQLYQMTRWEQRRIIWHNRLVGLRWKSRTLLKKLKLKINEMTSYRG